MSWIVLFLPLEPGLLQGHCPSDKRQRPVLQRCDGILQKFEFCCYPLIGQSLGHTWSLKAIGLLLSWVSLGRLRWDDITMHLEAKWDYVLFWKFSVLVSTLINPMGNESPLWLVLYTMLY